MLSVALLSGCGRGGERTYEVASSTDVQELLEAEKAHHSMEKKIKAVNFKLIYIPAEQFALREMGDMSAATQAGFDSLVKAYAGLSMFNLEIRVDGFNEELVHYQPGGRAVDFEKVTAYYAFGMQKDIYIVQSEKDTIPCTVYHYERNYGISPNNNFMLGFEAANLKEAVLVYDNDYLKTGPVKFALNALDQNKHPQIKIK